MACGPESEQDLERSKLKFFFEKETAVRKTIFALAGVTQWIQRWLMD